MFETPRLNYKITSERDIDDIQRCLNETEISDAIYFIPHPYTHDHAKEWVRKSQAGARDKTEWLLSVYLKDSDTYVGSVNIHKDKEDSSRAEVGYWLSSSYWRKGYGSEMLSGIISYVFDVLEFKTLFATVAIDNTASQKTLERHGFMNRRAIKLLESDGRRDSYYYEIKAPE